MQSQSRKEYMIWYRSQPAYKEMKARHDKKYRETHKEQARQYDKEHKDRINFLIRERRKLNGDEIRKKEKEYKDKNRENVRLWRKNWYWNNLEKSKEQARKSLDKDKARIRKANYKIKRRLKILSGDKLRTEIIKELKEQQNNKCYYCKNELGEYHLDHLIPLAKGGQHKGYNVALACPNCNLRKNDMYPDEFIKLRIAI